VFKAINYFFNYNVSPLVLFLLLVVFPALAYSFAGNKYGIKCEHALKLTKVMTYTQSVVFYVFIIAGYIYNKLTLLEMIVLFVLIFAIEVFIYSRSKSMVNIVYERIQKKKNRDGGNKF